jgi:hypothetical protein
MPDFEIYSPSYRRADKVISHHIMPRLTYVVSESEAEAYRSRGLRVWAVPDSAQGNVARIRNYILDHAKSKRLMLVDDDIKRIGRMSATSKKIVVLAPHEIEHYFANGFQLCEDGDLRFWGVNILPDRKAFKACTPFSFTSPILGPVQGFNNLDLRYDETLPLKEDYDLSLQVLNKYRRALRINFLCYFCHQNEIIGGCAATRTIEREKEQLARLREKWGSKIVRIDRGSAAKSNKNTKAKTKHDLNPIIKAPIPGV